MPELLAPQSATEGELLERARLQDSLAVAELYRRHRAAAESYAAGLTDPQRAADITADAMLKVFGLLERGLGPERAFRSYLFATVRTLVVDHARKAARETPVEDLHGFGDVTIDDVNDTRAEHADVVAAFRSLSPRSQRALWENLVEGRPLDEVGEHLDLTANAVAALAFRAREALRQAYLAQHLACVSQAECERYADQLPKHVRGKLRGRARRDLEAHLDSCHDCSTAAVALASINQRLAAILLPAALAGSLAFAVPDDSVADLTARVRTVTSAGAGAAGRAFRTATAGVVAVVLATGGALWWRTSAPQEAPVAAQPSEVPSQAPRADVVAAADSVTDETVADPSAASGAVSTLGHVASNWAHVSFPVVVDAGSTVRVRTEGARRALVHTDAEHGQWDCTPADATSAISFSCAVPAGQWPSTAIALDVERGPGDVRVSVEVTSDGDLDRSNNTASLTLRR